MDEHQLFEMALATTIEELNVSFPLKEEQRTAFKAFLWHEGHFCCFTNQMFPDPTAF